MANKDLWKYFPTITRDNNDLTARQKDQPKVMNLEFYIGVIV